MSKSLISEYQPLMRLGMSKTMVACYASLFTDGGTNASELAKHLNVPRTGVYRVLKRLETEGFIASLRAASQPTYFFAQPLDRAFEDYVRYQRKQIEGLTNKQKKILMKRASS